MVNVTELHDEPDAELEPHADCEVLRDCDVVTVFDTDIVLVGVRAPFTPYCGQLIGAAARPKKLFVPAAVTWYTVEQSLALPPEARKVRSKGQKAMPPSSDAGSCHDKKAPGALARVPKIRPTAVRPAVMGTSSV